MIHDLLGVSISSLRTVSGLDLRGDVQLIAHCVSRLLAGPEQIDMHVSLLMAVDGHISARNVT